MNYYWSCWFDKEELKSMGAIGIIIAQFNWSHILPYQHGVGAAKHFAFQADNSFLLFLKLKSDKNAVEISKRYYCALQRGDNVKVGESKIGKNIVSLLMDF